MKYISLFSGCGGLDIGFSKAGFSCAAAYEIDRYSLDVYRSNFNCPAYHHDLSTLEVSNMPSAIDVLIAGPPCQGFSTAGKRLENDPRNQLLLAAGKIAIKIRPKVIVVENVAGVTAGGHRRYWDGLKGMLAENGFRCAELKCIGTRMGVPQTRTRMILIAWSGKKEVTLNFREKAGGVLGDVLHDLEGCQNHEVKMIDPKSEIGLIARRIRPGQKLSNVRGGDRAIHTWDIPEVFGEATAFEKAVLEAILRIRRQKRRRENGDADPVPEEVLKLVFGAGIVTVLRRLVKKKFLRIKEGHYDLMHTFNGKFRRLSLNAPSLTVDTRFGDPRYFLHPDENRGFTVREAARIQGFPDSFHFKGPENEQYKMIGNAVPPPLATLLAETIRDSFFS